MRDHLHPSHPSASRALVSSPIESSQLKLPGLGGGLGRCAWAVCLGGVLGGMFGSVFGEYVCYGRRTNAGRARLGGCRVLPLIVVSLMPMTIEPSRLCRTLQR